MPLTLEASCRSSSMVRWVSATTTAAPPARNSFTAAAAVSSTGGKLRPGPAFDSRAESGVIRPMKPTVMPSTVLVQLGTVVAKAEPSADRTLVPIQGNFDSDIRRFSTSGPKSNSWLPKVTASTPMALNRVIICSPWVVPDSSDGDRKSPPTVVKAPGAASRSRFSRVISGPNPPCPFTGAISYTSLMCRKVSKPFCAQAGKVMPRMAAISGAARRRVRGRDDMGTDLRGAAERTDARHFRPPARQRA